MEANMIKVFIQSEAGSFEKKRYNEKTLEYLSTSKLPLAYPYPYGFILDTEASDGDNLDRYIVTSSHLKSGAIVECEPIGLLEQFEDGEIDHKILASLPGEKPELNKRLYEQLQKFIYGVFAQWPDCFIKVGEILSQKKAYEVIEKSYLQKDS